MPSHSVHRHNTFEEVMPSSRRIKPEGMLTIHEQEYRYSCTVLKQGVICKMVETEFGRKTNKTEEPLIQPSQLNDFHGLLNVKQISFRLWFLCELNSIYCLLAKWLWVEQLLVFNSRFPIRIECLVH